MSGEALQALLAEVKSEAKHLRVENRLKDLIDRTTKCDGSDPTTVRLWIREIELVEAEYKNDGMILLAQRTATGSFRAELELFLAQYRNADGNPVERGNTPWNEVRAHLCGAFLTSDETAHARTELEGIKQTKYEQEASYNRRFRDLCAVAYPIGDRNLDQQATMIKLYGRGLYSDSIARELVRKRPKPESIEKAMKEVLEVVTRNDDYNRLGREEEPMEIGAVGGLPQKPADAVIMEELQKLRKDFNKLKMKQTPTGSSSKPPSIRRNNRQVAQGKPPAWNQQGLPRCFTCQRYGHMAFECPRRSGNARADANRRS